MAAAFDRAGFDAVDVHMTDLLAAGVDLADFRALAACGGFSYGDVLGAGRGWAKSILFHPRARDAFAAFFAAPGHLRARRLQRLPDALGAQGAHPGRGALAALRAQPQRAVRGAPRAGRDRRDPVDLLPGMAGSRHPDRRRARRGPRRVRDDAGGPRARARGRSSPRASSTTAAARPSATRRTRTARPTASPRSRPPTAASRIIMPHPERVFRTVQLSWHPRRVGRGQPVDAPLPQRARLGRLALEAPARGSALQG